MALVTRLRIPRGVRLVPDHAFDVMDDAATALRGQVDAVQIVERMAPFRVTFEVPVLGGSFFADVGERGLRNHYMIPFVLPPWQQRFSGTATRAATDLVPVLDEVSIGWDSRDEPAVIRDVADAAEGDLDYTNLADTSDIRLSIRSKKPEILGGTDRIPRDEILALEYPAALFQAAHNRSSPIAVSGLERALDPYRTHVLFIEASGLAKLGGPDLCLPSFHVSLRFRAVLSARSTVAAQGVQNAPTKHSLATAAPVITIQRPLAGTTPIAADGALGVQTNLEILDDILLERLKGGVGRWSDVPAAQHIRQDAAYDVIAVPMFAFGRGITQANANELPYVGGVPYAGAACDRQIVPLPRPIILHHVIAVSSHALFTGGAFSLPQGGDHFNDVGVALGAGMRGDTYAYQQLARARWAANNAILHRIDRITERDTSAIAAGGPGGPLTHALFAVPLVDGGALGTGYPTGVGTGRPIFCGSGMSGTQARTQIGSAPAGVLQDPLTDGMEQWIEVRWTVQDAVAGLGGHPATTVHIGYGGHWVLLVVERHLTAPGHDGEV